MKPMIKTVLMSTLFLGIAFTSFAQPGRGNRPSPEERAQQQTVQMTEHLNLSDDQQKEVGDINLSYTKKMVESRQEAGDDRTAMRSKMESLMEEKTAELKKILTEEQFKQLEELKSQYGQGRQRDQAKKGKRSENKKGRKPRQ